METKGWIGVMRWIMTFLSPHDHKHHTWIIALWPERDPSNLGVAMETPGRLDISDGVYEFCGMNERPGRKTEQLRSMIEVFRATWIIEENVYEGCGKTGGLQSAWWALQEGIYKIFLKITLNLGFSPLTFSLYTKAKSKIWSDLFYSVHILLKRASHKMRYKMRYKTYLKLRLY